MTGAPVLAANHSALKGVLRPPDRSLRDRRIEALFHRQHFVASRAQILEAGGTPDLIKSRVAAGRWEALYRGVYRPAGAALTDLGGLLGAVLAVGRGALLSHEAAAWLWGLLDGPCPRPSVTAFGGRGAHPPGVHVVHAKLAATPSLRQGIPVTNPLRSVVDLGVGGQADLVAIAIDRGVAARLFTPEALAAELDRLAPTRKPGLGVVRDVLAEISAVSVRSPSVLQNAFARVLARAGLPPPVAEFPVLSGRYRLDYAYPDALLAFELDGREHHGDWRSIEEDHLRRRVLARLGWTVMVFSAADVWQRAELMTAEVREALVSRGVPCPPVPDGCAPSAGTGGGGRRRPPRTRPPARGSREEERAPPCG